MNDPKRLLESSDNPITRNLLAAGFSDNPPADALQRAATALGIGALTTAATSGVFASGVASQAISGSSASAAGTSLAGALGSGAKLPCAGGALSAGSAAAASSTSVSVLKWLGIGLIGGGAVAGTAHGILSDAPQTSQSAHASARSNEQKQTPRSSPQRLTKALPTQSSERLIVSPAPQHEADVRQPSQMNRIPQSAELVAPTKLPEPARRSRSTASFPIADTALPPAPAATQQLGSVSAAQGGVGRPSVTTENSRALQHELSLIDAAKHALAAADSSRTLALLDQYAAQRKLGVFDREALILRIDAQLSRGSLSEARRFAAKYLATYPKDSHTPRLERLISGSKNLP